MNAIRRAAVLNLKLQSDKPRTAKECYEEVKAMKLKGKRKCVNSTSC